MIYANSRAIELLHWTLLWHVGVSPQHFVSALCSDVYFRGRGWTGYGGQVGERNSDCFGLWALAKEQHTVCERILKEQHKYQGLNKTANSIYDSHGRCISCGFNLQIFESCQCLSYWHHQSDMQKIWPIITRPLFQDTLMIWSGVWSMQLNIGYIIYHHE